MNLYNTKSEKINQIPACSADSFQVKNLCAEIDKGKLLNINTATALIQKMGC